MMATLEEKIALLERQQQMTTELVKRILEGKWTGGAESAEALLLALNPQLQTEAWHAVPFVEPEG